MPRGGAGPGACARGVGASGRGPRGGTTVETAAFTFMKKKTNTKQYKHNTKRDNTNNTQKQTQDKNNTKAKTRKHNMQVDFGGVQSRSGMALSNPIPIHGPIAST